MAPNLVASAPLPIVPNGRLLSPEEALEVSSWGQVVLLNPWLTLFVCV